MDVVQTVCEESMLAAQDEVKSTANYLVNGEVSFSSFY